MIIGIGYDDPILVGIIALGLMFGMAVLGMRVAFAAALAGFLGLVELIGWWPGATTEPPALHMMLTPAHEAAMDDFLRDLEEATLEVEKGAVKAAKEVRYS